MNKDLLIEYIKDNGTYKENDFYKYWKLDLKNNYSITYFTSKMLLVPEKHRHKQFKLEKGNFSIEINMYELSFAIQELDYDTIYQVIDYYEHLNKKKEEQKRAKQEEVKNFFEGINYNHLCNIISRLPYDSWLSGEGSYLQTLEVNNGTSTHSFKLEEEGFHVYMGHSHYFIPYSKENTIVSVIKTLVEEG